MNNVHDHNVETIRSLLATIADPEIPVINIVELGIIRDVRYADQKAYVSITPTYSGCPAMKMIEDEITLLLSRHGYTSVSINTIYAPAWSTDWITEDAKLKLKQYGIAPPRMVESSPLLQIEMPRIACPHCQSHNTMQKSEFGSTACKAYYYCHSCHQAFEYFKPF